MSKHTHEFRDPVHDFITVSTDERNVIDSRGFQRLRHIHQLGLTLLLYPGATHGRFEHSLGVMDVAARIFDVLSGKRRADLAALFPPDDQLRYWREVVRMGALCHDLGHMPFSHSAEELLPDGYHHEQLSVDVIRSEEMRRIWDAMTPPLRPDDVAKVAVGPEKWPGGAADYSPWIRLMSAIVTDDAFGADRIDYLLRDSLHAGVAYGKFDHHRLLGTLKILTSHTDRETPVIGIELGGIHAAEALQQARYSMFSQLYLHRVRRAYDLHLKEFLAEWLDGGRYSVDLERHLTMTDNDVFVAIHAAAVNGTRGHGPARRIVNREHYRVLYRRRAEDLKVNLNPEAVIFDAARAHFGEENVRLDPYRQKSRAVDFSVERNGGEIVSSLQESEILNQIPGAAAGYVFIVPELREQATKWLEKNHEAILVAVPPGEEA
jgi:HD superfamily phosphohydrolase